MSDRNETEAKRRQYTEEFKTEAVRLLEESGKTDPALIRRTPLYAAVRLDSASTGVW